MLCAAFALGVRVTKAHGGDVNCVRWHPKPHTLLASAGDDGFVCLWEWNQDSEVVAAMEE